jgi:hypothetical protein
MDGFGSPGMLAVASRPQNTVGDAAIVAQATP